MTERELKRLSRIELLEVIVMQSDELEAVKKEKDGLQAENEDLKKKLDDREIAISNAGSLAEASLAVTNIFAEAEKAAAIYKENVARMGGGADFVSAQQDDAPAGAGASSDSILADAKQKAAEILDEAKRKARTLLVQAEQYGQRTRQQADAYWEETKQKVERFLSERAGLRELLSMAERKNNG